MSSGWTAKVPAGRHPGYLEQRFGNLQLRLKLILLHNLFFLVLSGSVYFTVFPLLEQRVAGDKAREIGLILEQFSAAAPPPGLASYGLETGSSRALGVPPAAQEWLDGHPGGTFGDPKTDTFLYRRDGPEGPYRKIRMPHEYHARSLEIVRLALFTVLGIIYILAVLLLELVIMPLYVYRPLTAMLEADHASRTGDHRREMIPPHLIPGDEIGQIMQSRNETVAELRGRERELEHALENLETAKRTMADQDRLVSLGVLSAGVAHELNTPLAVLQGSIEKLLETVPEPHAQDRLKRMQRVAARLKTISEGLLDFARVRRQEKAEVAIGELVEEAWQLVGLDEKATRVTFANEIPEECRVWGNADRLMQVFVNLIRNALQAVPDTGGHIRAAAHSQMDHAERWWQITVEDNGPGIPADVLPDIFEAFISTKLDAKGTGLGLTVSEGIIHQHGGTIGAANHPGGGARLEIRLPEAPVNLHAAPPGANAYAG